MTAVKCTYRRTKNCQDDGDDSSRLRVVVQKQEHRADEEELHVVRQIPRPANALSRERVRPRVQVLDVQQVRPPVLPAGPR